MNTCNRHPELCRQRVKFQEIYHTGKPPVYLRLEGPSLTKFPSSSRYQWQKQHLQENKRHQNQCPSFPPLHPQLLTRSQAKSFVISVISKEKGRAEYGRKDEEKEVCSCRPILPLPPEKKKKAGGGFVRIPGFVVWFVRGSSLS
jgi:hypothetical protein